MTPITDRLRELETALRDLLNVIAADDLIPESVSYMRQARAALTPTPARTTDEEKDDLTRRDTSGSQPPRSAASTDAKGSER
jgi:hypothetical protein